MLEQIDGALRPLPLGRHGVVDELQDVRPRESGQHHRQERLRLAGKLGAAEIPAGVEVGVSLREFATHADTTLQILAQATAAEKEILGAFPYQPNVATLHSDTSVMPKRKKAWASWNYHVGKDPSAPPTITYWMNLLQSIDSPKPLFVTLNREHEIDPSLVHGQWNYAHPLYTEESVAAQARRTEIQGVDRIWYAGAYWGYGFHEDGARSGVEVARGLGVPFAEDLGEREIDRLLLERSGGAA